MSRDKFLSFVKELNDLCRKYKVFLRISDDSHELVQVIEGRRKMEDACGFWCLVKKIRGKKGRWVDITEYESQGFSEETIERLGPLAEDYKKQTGLTG